MGFHWPMANGSMLHNQINGLSLCLIPRSRLSGGLLMLRLVRRHLKTSADMCEKSAARDRRLKLFDLHCVARRAEGFSAARVNSSTSQRMSGIYRNLQMLLMLIVSSTHITAADAHRLYVRWPRSAAEKAWLNVSVWCASVNFMRTSVSGQCRRREKGWLCFMSGFSGRQLETSL